MAVVQVFLPLLVEYFTEPELKKLTQDIIELHHLNDSGTYHSYVLSIWMRVCI